ncbi:MAG: FKBP-type peptidyl-prolyl cis-trans isomerase [Nanobdellota archaeon]
MAVKEKDWVSVSYKGTLSDGTVFDTNEGKEPLKFEVGTGKVIKGFDDNIVGMEEGNSKEFTIPCKDAYGEMSDNNTQEVPMDFFKDVEKVEPGLVFMAQSAMGPLKVKVLEVDEDNKKSKVALNHPLAGEDLTFNIKVDKILSDEEIEQAKKEEQERMEKIKQMQQQQQQQSESGSEESCEGCSGCDTSKSQ